MNRSLSFLVLLLPSILFAQIEGDNIFGTDQVLTIDLEFPQADYWSQLTSNYDDGDNVYIAAHLQLTDITGTYSMDSVGVRLKGNSSYNHPGNKKSFKIDFNKFIDEQNYDGLKKLNFSNGFKDPSVIREKVFFDVCRQAGVPAPRASFAQVNFNGEPWGFYTIIEQIDDQFLDWNIEEDDGNLFKAGDNYGGPGQGGDGAADLAYYGSEQSSYAERYELKTNEDENDWTDLIEFIDFIDNSSQAEFDAGIAERFEIQDYLRSAALNILFSNLDTYTGSARNYYLYHNMDTDRWEWVKWDGNECFGSYTNQEGNMLTLGIDYHDSPRPLLDKIMSSDVYYEQYQAEMCYLLDNFFNSEYMDARIDETKLLVQDYVYADDNKMYTDALFDTNIESNVNAGGGGMGGGGTTYGLKSFVEDRSAYITGQLDCSLFTSVEEVQATDFELYPNPAEDYIMVDAGELQIDFLIVYDQLGRELDRLDMRNQASMSLDVSAYDQGLYHLELITAGLRISQSFIK